MVCGRPSKTPHNHNAHGSWLSLAEITLNCTPTLFQAGLAGLGASLAFGASFFTSCTPTAATTQALLSKYGLGKHSMGDVSRRGV
jgi:hypothetical protein